MNEQLIREIANQASTHAEDSVDYYNGIGNDGLSWEAKILKARDLKFTELIVRECVSLMESEKDYYSDPIAYESREYYERMRLKKMRLMMLVV